MITLLHCGVTGKPDANADTCGATKSQTKRKNSVDEDAPVSKRAKKEHIPGRNTAIIT